MLFSGSGSAAPIEYLFIDGGSIRGYLENISRRFFDGAGFDIDLTSYSSRFEKTFYYDAIPVRESGESEHAYTERLAPQHRLFERLRATDGVHVYEGDARRRRTRGLEQKMVDVMLAVDMLTHTFRGNMQRATLITGDQDFKPLVDALVREGMYVSLWYPPSETNGELIAAADRRIPMLLRDLRMFLTVEAQERFKLPTVENKNPVYEPVDDRLCEWSTGSRTLALYCGPSGWTVTQSGDELNRLHVQHHDWELLRFFGAELGIGLEPTPEEQMILARSAPEV